MTGDNNDNAPRQRRAAFRNPANPPPIQPQVQQPPVQPPPVQQPVVQPPVVQQPAQPNWGAPQMPQGPRGAPGIVMRAPPPVQQPQVQQPPAQQQPVQQPPVQQPGWGGIGNRPQGQGGAQRVGLNRVPAPMPQPAPVQPVMAANTIPADQAAWNQDMLRFLGWSSKSAEHGAVNASIATLMQPHAYDRTPLISGLRQQQVDLDAAYQANGVWDSAQEMKAAEVRATLTFENMPGKKAEVLGGTANPTFWVKGTPDPITGETREYIFKPETANPTAAWMPDRGEPAREAMAGRVADQLGAFTGLDFQMPTTNVITVDTARLADHQGPGLDMTQPTLVGSLQQFSPNQGALRQRISREKHNVPAQECQNMAILDTCMLNLDRHPGNLLIDQNGGLLPIDHGLSFPNLDAIRRGALADMTNEKNVLLALPAAFKPFTAESLAGIANINPDLMADALTAERDTIAQVHPETANTVQDESIAIAKRSAMFLKLAAPVLSPAVVQIALGGQAVELLDPQIDEDRFLRVANRVIRDYAEAAPALQEYNSLTPHEQKAISALAQNRVPGGSQASWMTKNMPFLIAYARGGGQPTPVVPRQPQPAAPLPLDQRAVEREVQQVMPKLKLAKDEAASWMAQWETVRGLGGVAAIREVLQQTPATPMTSITDAIAALQKKRRDNVAAAREAKIRALLSSFPRTALRNARAEDEAIEQWEKFQAAGGSQALAAAQQRHPDLPQPTDPGAALILIMTPPVAANKAVMDRLDYLDHMVQIDPTLVSAANQAAIIQMRADVQANLIQGDVRSAVDALVDSVTADCVDSVKARFDAIRANLTPGDWEYLESGTFSALFEGDFAVPMQELNLRHG